MSSAPAAALPIAFLGLLFVCLWKGRGRWLGVPAACAVLLWPRPPAPDLWIASDGANLAIRDGRKALPLRPDVKAFALDVWSRRRGLEAEPDAKAALAQRYDCGRYACLPKSAGADPAYLWSRKPPDVDALTSVCQRAPLVVIRAETGALPPACSGRLVLDGADLAQRGATELWRDGPRWRALSVSQVRGARPWTGLPAT